MCPAKANRDCSRDLPFLQISTGIETRVSKVTGSGSLSLAKRQLTTIGAAQSYPSFSNFAGSCYHCQDYKDSVANWLGRVNISHSLDHHVLSYPIARLSLLLMFFPSFPRADGSRGEERNVGKVKRPRTGKKWEKGAYRGEAGRG